MIKVNYASKIQQVEKRIKQWEKRSLSPIGKITVIKTLLLPIFNNLWLSLPNPNNAVLNSIKEILYNFLWNKKAKIKKSVVVKQYCEGGLKMINIEAFSYALKVTWIRRLIRDNCKWQDYILKYVNIEKLTAVDTKSAEEIMKKIDNPIWKDVLTGFIKTNKTTELEEGISHILRIPIFYNSNICIDKKYVFWKDWYMKGIRFINHIVKENREFYNQDELVAKYNITTNYLHYQGITKSIKVFLNSHKITLTTNIEGPFIPKHLKPILQQKNWNTVYIQHS